MICLRLVLLTVLIAATCAATVGHDMFGHRMIKGQLREPLLNDISGMAASRITPAIWVCPQPPGGYSNYGLRLWMSTTRVWFCA
ncbi:hypothetical protein RRG08_055808 [Elysia crispata]|uniref:Uncharacterized protein n=1 Tax=Elysia crispata TaxID=231223 RepID=A0AAE1D9D9_9GAST|nr:hypothetical protein RRG08_055808 [Elysia crispata]